MQEILVTAVGAGSVAEAEQLNFAVHRAVGKRLSKTLSYPLGKGDEGGWAPGITDEEALQVVSEEAVRGPGREGQEDPHRLDVAADSLYDEKKGGYYYRSTKKTLSRDEQISFIGELTGPVRPLLHRGPALRGRLRGIRRAPLRRSRGTLIVGDDLYTTDTERLKTGHRERRAPTVSS